MKMVEGFDQEALQECGAVPRPVGWLQETVDPIWVFE